MAAPDATVFIAGESNLRNSKTIAAGVTDSVLTGVGAGAIGDYLDGITVYPDAANCGSVTLKDGAGAAFTLFPGGGTVALPSLIPFFVPIREVSLAGAWKVTTGANVRVKAVGKFT